MKTKLSLAAVGGLLLLGAASVSAQPYFIFPNGISGGVRIDNFHQDDPGDTNAANQFSVTITGAQSYPPGMPALWQVTGDNNFTGSDIAQGPAVIDPSPPDGWDPNDPLNGWDPFNPSGDALIAPPIAIETFYGTDSVDNSIDDGFTLDLANPDVSLIGTTIDRYLDGSGWGLDYAVPGLILPFVDSNGIPLVLLSMELNVVGNVITEIVDLSNCTMELLVPDNTAGTVFVEQLEFLDEGTQTEYVIDGPFAAFTAPGENPPGKYIPVPQTIALLGLGLAGLVGFRRRERAVH